MEAYLFPADEVDMDDRFSMTPIIYGNTVNDLDIKVGMSRPRGTIHNRARRAHNEFTRLDSSCAFVGATSRDLQRIVAIIVATTIRDSIAQGRRS